jgi:ATP-dependent helicase/nuclease subunit A
MIAAYQHNGRPISAEAFYAIACDPRRNVAVEACAGSGKTWMLVSRIVRALLADLNGPAGEVRPHEILAITFTKKAAGEMRERLHEWLAQFSQADEAELQRELEIRGLKNVGAVETNSSSQIGPQPNQDGRKQLSNLYRLILESGRSVQIRTFHSWFAALLRNAPVQVLQDLHLPLAYELLEDDAPAKALVWPRFYAALAQNAELHSDFNAVVLAYGRSQTAKALASALDKRVEFALADAAGKVNGSVAHFTVQFSDCAGLDHPEAWLTGNAANRRTLAAAAAALGRASAVSFSAGGVKLEQALATGDVPSMVAALLTTTGTPRKFSDKVAGLAQVREAQELVLRLLAARAQHEAWGHQQRMARLSRLLLAEFAALKQARGWIDMNDVERAAVFMLCDPVLSGWVQQRLDSRIRHLLIDEFQDTNPLQWQALSSWLQSYGGAVGSASAPSVFLVGDPKQSIYRFRRAEPQIFRAAQAFVQGGLRGDLLACDHTRRNAPEVIAAVNTVMAQAASLDGYDGFRPHTTDSRAQGAVVRFEPIPRAEKSSRPGDAGWRDSLTTPRELPEETLRTHEARQAAAWIAAQVAAGSRPEKMMILSRKRSGLLPMQEALRALHIPAQIGEKTPLIERCEVQDLVALFDALCSPRHDLSLARALRSPLFALDDSALVTLALMQRENPIPWFDLLQKTELLATDLIGLGAVLMRWKGWVDAWPPHDALQRIYDDGDVLARFAAAAPPTQRNAVLANLRALLSVALDLDGGRYLTPYRFVRLLKAGDTPLPATLDASAVRLLTIHGAKGLEADTVLLLDTDTPERPAESMGVLIDWPGESHAPERFVFLLSESRPSACAAALLASEQQARRREEINALYVAMTRARCTLAVSSIVPHRDASLSWWQRLSPAATELARTAGPAIELAGWPQHDVPDAKVDESRDEAAAPADCFDLLTLPTLPQRTKGPGTFMPSIRNIEPTDLVDDSTSRRIGLAMHRLLEWGGAASPAQCVAVAREFALSPAHSQQAADMARRILTGEAAWAWQTQRLGWHGNEVEMLLGGQLLRLDRLVQRIDAGHEGHWWVLDYKSALTPGQQPALLAQMQLYRAAVQQAYPGANVQAAFLTGQGNVVVVSPTF